MPKLSVNIVSYRNDKTGETWNGTRSCCCCRSRRIGWCFRDHCPSSGKTAGMCRTEICTCFGRQSRTKLNMEMAATDEMQRDSAQVKPNFSTLVPEKREELTTEGGLEVASRVDFLKSYVARLQQGGIMSVSSLTLMKANCCFQNNRH